MKSKTELKVEVLLKGRILIGLGKMLTKFTKEFTTNNKENLTDSLQLLKNLNFLV